VKLEWMMLANHAEVANDLLYISGGGWDTIQVGGQLPGAPEGIVGAMLGHLAIRLLFHVTETDRTHTFQLSIMAEDGQQIANLEGEFPVATNPNVPPGWLQNVNLVFPMAGLLLPHEGLYTINFNVNGQWVGDRPFRVQRVDVGEL